MSAASAALPARRSIPTLDPTMALSLRVSWEHAQDPVARAVYEDTAARWLGERDAGRLVLTPAAVQELEKLLRPPGAAPA